MMSEQQSKRRRISDVVEINLPAAVVGSSPESHSNQDTPSAVSVETLVPTLDEIPNLVFVELHRDNAVEVASSLKRLYKLCSKKKNEGEGQKVDNTKEACDLGAVGIIVIVLRKFGANHDVQLRGLDCLSCFLREKGRESSLFVKSGGYEAVVNAMKRFPGSPELQQGGMRALCNSLLERGNHVVRFVEKLRGIQLVVKTLKSFPDDYYIQLDGCGALCSLTGTKHNEALFNSGAIATTAIALEKYKEDKRFKRFATKFMSQMFPPKKQG